MCMQCIIQPIRTAVVDHAHRYGDITAQTTVEQLVCAFVMCSGCVFLGFLVGTFSHLINEASAEGRRCADDPHTVYSYTPSHTIAWCFARILEVWANVSYYL